MAEQPTHVGDQDTGWRPGCGHGRFFVIARTGDVYCTDCEDVRPGPPNPPIPPALRAQLEAIADDCAEAGVYGIGNRLRRLLDLAAGSG